MNRDRVYNQQTCGWDWELTGSWHSTIQHDLPYQHHPQRDPFRAAAGLPEIWGFLIPSLRSLHSSSCCIWSCPQRWSRLLCPIRCLPKKTGRVTGDPAGPRKNGICDPIAPNSFWDCIWTCFLGSVFTFWGLGNDQQKCVFVPHLAICDPWFLGWF